MPNDQTQFLYESVRDIQNTIRTLDTKTNYLMVALVIPLVKLGVIFTKCVWLLKLPGHQWVFVPLVAVFVLFWGLAFLAVFKTLAAIDNPSEHITGDHPRGAFYSAGIFQTGSMDVFFNRALRSRVQFHQHLADTPATDDVIASELAFEQMKLVYIREVKMVRSRAGYTLSALWILSGGALWLSWLILI